jgi:hypothetical protein
LLASVGVIEFQIIEEYASLDLTRVKYNIYRHSRDEEEMATLRIRFKILNKFSKYTVDMNMQMEFRIHTYPSTYYFFLKGV